MTDDAQKARDREGSAAIIQLIKGTCVALCAEFEERLPQIPWDDELRELVMDALEMRIGPDVAEVLCSVCKPITDRAKLKPDMPEPEPEAEFEQSCRIHTLGFLVLCHWIPPLKGRSWTFDLGRWVGWWPRPGYDQWRPWRKLP